MARALVTNPKVVFADEPTGSLDSLTGEQVMDLLVGRAREQGTTVVLVTHDARVAAYADREAMVRDGKVASLTHRVGGPALMVRLGLQLTVHSGREAFTRPLITAVAVAIGVAVLLGRVCRVPRLPGVTSNRSCWECTQGPPRSRAAPGVTVELWNYSEDNYQRPDRSSVLDVAALGPSAPVVPGICQAARVPGSSTPHLRWPAS